MRVLAIVHQPDAGAGVFAEAIAASEATLEQWHPPTGEPAPGIDAVDAVLTFGGGMNADDDLAWLDTERAFLAEVIAAAKPLLGICLGAELVAQAAGGEVRRCSTPEIGWPATNLTQAASADPVLGFLPASFEAFQWHSYAFTLPDGAIELARSEVCSQAFVLGNTWAIQFHPEVTRADAERWIDDYRTDPDAVAIGLDPEALRAATRERIEPWNELGRRICRGFIEAALDRV